MRIMVLMLLVVSSLASAEQQSDTVRLQIPNMPWAIGFQSTPLQQVKLDQSDSTYYYMGTNGRATVSLYSSTPKCAGAEGDLKWIQCRFKPITDSPLTIQSSVKSYPGSVGIGILYLTNAVLDGKTVSTLNVNYLFLKDGKECDLHFSILGPVDDKDGEAFFATIQSVNILSQ